MNEKNLKPVRSKEEAREKGKRGGKASGEARREKKQFQQAVLAALKTSTRTRKHNVGGHCSGADKACVRGRYKGL